MSNNICTYNIRYDNKFDKNWSWKERKGYILNLLKIEKFDIIGIQEALLHQVEDLKTLNQYEILGFSRSGNPKEDEYNLIMYNKEKFTLIDKGYFWLSKTPDFPSFYAGAGCMRICVFGIFLDNETNKKCGFAVTHLDNLSKDARVFSANLILEKLQDVFKNIPVVIMGDFNATPDDEVYKIMCSKFKEVKNLCNLQHRGTFTSDADFLVNSDAKQLEIDFIFVNEFVNVHNVNILKNSAEGKYISDHFALTSEISY